MAITRSLHVKVKPNACEEVLEAQADGTWLAKIKAPPVDGKANAALIALVARHFGLPKSRVELRSGASGRLKRIDLNEA